MSFHHRKVRERLVAREARVVIGARDAYEARCRLHWRADPEDTQQRLPLPSE